MGRQGAVGVTPDHLASVGAWSHLSSPQAEFQQTSLKMEKGRASLWLTVKPGPGDREDVSTRLVGREE